MAEEGKTRIIEGNLLNVSPKNKRSASANNYFEEPISQVTNPIAHDRAMIRRLVEQSRIAPDENTARGIVIAVQEDISAADLIEFPDTKWFKKSEANDQNKIKKYSICYVRLFPEDANDDHMLEFPNYLKTNYETGTSSPRMLSEDQDRKLISLHTKVLAVHEEDHNPPDLGSVIYLKFTDSNRRRAIMIGDGPIGQFKTSPPAAVDPSAVERFTEAQGLKQTVGNQAVVGDGTRSLQDIEDWKTRFASQEEFILVPTSGQLTSPKQKFRELKGKAHPGIDIGVPIGSEVVAMLPGEVSYVNSTRLQSEAGLYITIDHSAIFPGVYTRYLHLNKPLVKPGTLVLAGDLIAYSGNTGKFTTGPHLHFEVRVGKPGLKTWKPEGSVAVNPIPYLIQDPEFYNKLKIKNGSVARKIAGEEDIGITEEQFHMWMFKSGLREVDTAETSNQNNYRSENDDPASPAS